MTRTTRLNYEKKSVPVVKSILTEDETQRNIFLLNNQLKITSNLIFYCLRHPGTERKAYFHYFPETQKLFQIIQVKEPNRSFLIDENISSNGKFYITIPFDVTFLYLYYIRRNCNTKAMSIDHIYDTDYPELSKLLADLVNEDLLDKISDIKKSGGTLYFKYNKSKTLAWLGVKTKRLSKQLDNKVVLPGFCGSVSSNYTKSQSLHKVNKTEYLHQACDIVGTFLIKELKIQLMDYLLILDIQNNKRKSTNIEKKNYKKFKSENNVANSIQSSPIIQPANKETGQSNKQIKLARAAAGTKNIAFFFAKK